MLRVEGIRLKTPAGVKLNRMLGSVEQYRMPGLGYMEKFRILGDHELEMAFVGETDAGEVLARRMKEGGAWLDVVVPAGVFPGMHARQLALRICWEREDDLAKTLVDEALAGASILRGRTVLPRRTVGGESDKLR